MHRPGTELATSRSRVRRPTTTVTEQPAATSSGLSSLPKIPRLSIVMGAGSGGDAGQLTRSPVRRDCRQRPGPCTTVAALISIFCCSYNKMLLVVAAITFKFYCKFYCTCDRSISSGYSATRCGSLPTCTWLDRVRARTLCVIIEPTDFYGCGHIDCRYIRTCVHVPLRTRRARLDFCAMLRDFCCSFYHPVSRSFTQ